LLLQCSTSWPLLLLSMKLLLALRLLQVLQVWRSWCCMQLVWLLHNSIRQQQLERAWDQQDVRAQLTAAAAAAIAAPLANAAAAAAAAAVWAGQPDCDGVVSTSHDGIVAAAEHLQA
jgi:hypothetical protein